MRTDTFQSGNGALSAQLKDPAESRDVREIEGLLCFQREQLTELEALYETLRGRLADVCCPVPEAPKPKSETPLSSTVLGNLINNTNERLMTLNQRLQFLLEELQL
ncbi:MAG TPA: hypothetical protein DIT13_04960 [Verrucomicrobiales bacterium]|nr:hypothetical protein [Verrucomicrobiales bacterium]HRJ09303.1 hypothetical protein [Prosthecobacter sp.]HRK15588.1 hypothetical protein [Prosthecobacter sp.]